MNEQSRTKQLPNEELFRALVQNSSDMISLLDADGTVVYQSPSIERLLGYRTEDRIGRNIFIDAIVHPDDGAAHRVFFDAVRSTTGMPVTGQFRLRHADGSWKDVEAVGQNFLHDPAVAGIVVNYRDITERKQSEDALRRTSQLLQAVADGTQDAVYVKDREGRHLMFNAAASRMVGKPIQDVLGRDDTAVFGSGNAGEVMAHDQQVMESGTAASEEHELITNGVTRTYLASKAPYRDAQGNVIGVIGICHDITDRKRIEEALRASEQRWRNLTETLPQLIWSATADGSCDYFSAQWTEHTGVSEPDLLGWRWLETLHPDDREPTRQFWLGSVAEYHPHDIEYRVRRRDGEYRWFKTRGVPVRDSNGAIIKWFGTGTDITELRETQEALRQANARVELAVRSSSISIWDCDMPDGRIVNAHLTLFNVWESLGYDARAMPTDFSSAVAVFFHPDDQERVGSEIQELLASDGHEWKNEYRALAKDGSIRWLLARGTVLRDPDGKPVRFIGTSTDIAQLRQTREALRQANARVELAVRSSDISIWDCDMPDGRIDNARLTLFNKWESLGYDARTMPTDFSSVSAMSLHPADLERVRREIQELLASDGHEWRNEYRTLTKDGSTRWLLARGTVLRDPDGRPARLIGASTDITDRKRAEEALRESEQRFRTFVDHATDAFFLFDDHNVVLDVNRQACQSLGYSRDELLGMTPLDFDSDVTPERLDELKQKLDDEQLIAFESHYRRKDGGIFPVEIRGQTFWEGGRRFAVALARDVTERKRLEEEVRLATARLELALRGSNIGFWDIDMPDSVLQHGRVHYVNIWEQLGYERPDSPKDQETSAALVHPDDHAAHAEAARRYLAGETSEFELECRLRHKDGSLRWMISRGMALRDAEGKPTRFLGTVIDITDRKRIEEALRESEERFRGTFENAAVGIAHGDSVGRFLRVNQKFCAIIGYSREELTGKDSLDFTHPDDLATTDKLFAGLIRGDSLGYTIEKRYLRKDGSFVWAEVVVSLQRDAAGKPAYAIGVVQDISQRKRLDAELRRAKETAEAANRAKDEFLANVSHEIRTPMNAILGMAELTLDTALTDEQRGYLNIVLASAEGLLSLINDLLDFSKIEAGRLELDEVDFSLRSLLNQTLRALALRAHKKGLELACKVESDVSDGLVGDGNRLRQVLLNLIGNAIKFTEVGEVIVVVRLGNTDGQIVVVEFEIADSGIGIPPEKQQMIFQPFEQGDSSTTRRYGGTGLGLTIASRLVEIMGGKITVESEVGRGSTFRFSARFGRSAILAAAPAQPPVVDLHGLRVLIVDDNATNRTILHGWASAWGMTPTATEDVPAAMSALWRGVASKEPFALVLLDARMPGADGLELAKGISKTPELNTCRIILLTSDDRPGDTKRYRALRISAMLMKPVQQEELLDSIYRVLSHGAVGIDIVEFPRTCSPETVNEPVAPVVERSSRSLKVLVAEDNKFNQLVIQRMLERRGHAVRVVPTGPKTLAVLEQSAFDLLLLDVNMPEMDGFEVIRTIREREKTSGNHLRVIALTALSGKQDRERCIEAGMDDFLAKPVRAAEVYAALERVITTHPVAAVNSAESALIDPAIVLSGCAGDPALLADMIQLFEDEAPELLARVEGAVQSIDTEKLRIAAHALRGLISAFSTTVAKYAEVLEQLAIERRAGEAGEPYKSLNDAVQNLRAILPTLTIENLRSRI